MERVIKKIHETMKGHLNERQQRLFNCFDGDLESLVEPVTRGDPESPLRWSCKSTRKLAEELNNMGHKASHSTVAVLLSDLGYSLQGNKKIIEGESHPDRNAQFEYINKKTQEYQQNGQPVISVDTKKRK